MKFITEDELRYLYRKEPFTTYEPEPGTRLTPGARQFLLDRGIDMYDEQKKAPIIRESLTQEICCPSANPNHNSGTKETVAAPAPESSSVEHGSVEHKSAEHKVVKNENGANQTLFCGSNVSEDGRNSAARRHYDGAEPDAAV